MEARMTSLLQRAGITGAVPEHLVTDEHGGFIAVVDFAFPDARLAIEVDGYETHIPLAAFRDGKVRDRLLLAADWLPLHFSWSEVDRQHPRVADDIRRELKRRG
jgi:very-short-patch-repair endonuclease